VRACSYNILGRFYFLRFFRVDFLRVWLWQRISDCEKAKSVGLNAGRLKGTFYYSSQVLVKLSRSLKKKSTKRQFFQTSVFTNVALYNTKIWASYCDATYTPKLFYFLFETFNVLALHQQISHFQQKHGKTLFSVCLITLGAY